MFQLRRVWSHANPLPKTGLFPSNRRVGIYNLITGHDGNDNSLANTDPGTDQSHTVTRPVSKSVDWSVTVDNRQADEDVMQISGAGHWFLEGWIGDHAVDFLVDSGSAVTAVSRSFIKHWWKQEHRWVIYDPRLGSCAVRMGHRLTFQGAHLAWFHSWNSGQNFLFLYVT